METSEGDLIAHIEKLAKDAPFDWKPGHYYNDGGDFLQILWSDKPTYAEWINERVTLLRCQETDEVVGAQAWGVKNEANVTKESD